MSRMFCPCLLVALLTTSSGPAAKPKPLDALVRVLSESDDAAVQKDILAAQGARACSPSATPTASSSRGLTNYPSASVDRLRGVRTEKISEVLGSCPYEEVVHRDNLVVIV
jgi:glutamate 5-kinase